MDGGILSMIIGVGAEKTIALSTRKGTDIPNYQSREISHFEANQHSDLAKKHGVMCTRNPGTPIYNCHGMAFASRRTCITDPPALRTILDEDDYEEIDKAGVLPGDIIVYMSGNGDMEHSGVIIQEPSQAILNVPVVMSKWGKGCEVIHYGNKCPYDFSIVKYYRIKDENPVVI